MGTNYSDKEQQFNDLFANTRDKLYGFLSQYSKDSAFVEDIMQECYLQVWLKMGRWQDTEKLLPLIKKVARDLLIDAIRKKARLPETWIEALDKIPLAFVAAQDLTQPDLHSLDLH